MSTRVLAGVAALALALLLFAGLIGIAVLGAVSTALTTPDPTLTASGSLNTTAVPVKGLVPWLEKAGSLCPAISAPLLAAQIQQESGWNPKAVSPAGAEGISQFLLTTWPAWSQPPAGPGPDTPFNPYDSVMAQGRYMCALAAQMAPLAQTSGISVVSLALAAYNAGGAAVILAGGIPQNGQTPAYVTAILIGEATYEVVVASDVSSTNLSALAVAKQQLGVPYLWGGATPTGFDCSGLVMYAYAAEGITLPHNAGAQWADPTVVHIPADQAQPGDLVFFNPDEFGPAGGPGHVGFVTGPDTMLDAPDTGSVVRYDHISTFGPIVGYGRVTTPAELAAKVTAPAGAGPLELDDEFNGNTLDTPTWQTGYSYCLASGCTLSGNNEQEMYTAGGVTEGGGTLNLTATQQQTDGLPYRSGMIESRRTFTYGTFVAGFEAPAGAGLWSAPLWLDGADWPIDGELDLGEILGANPGTLYTTVHYGPDNEQTQVATGGADYSAGFHTVTLVWTPSSLTFSVDSNVVLVDNNPAAIPRGPMNVLANLAVGGGNSWGGAPDGATQFPATLRLDYIRVYGA